MNETLQQFCQRILPIVQAGAEGKEIEYFSKLTDGWSIKSKRAFDYLHEYRIAQPKATPLPITPEMWAMIDPKYEWAVFDGDDKVIFEIEPVFGNENGAWIERGGDVVVLPLSIDTTGIIPELSLTKRPDAESKPEPHDDCQLLVVSSWGAKSPLESALDEMCACGVPDRLFKFLSNIPTK